MTIETIQQTSLESYNLCASERNGGRIGKTQRIVVSVVKRKNYAKNKFNSTMYYDSAIRNYF